MTNQNHEHKWMVFSTLVDDNPRATWILVRCDCGDVGAIKNNTLEEWNKAHHAPSSNYLWNEPERVEVIEGYTTIASLERKGGWDVIKKRAIL